MIARPFLLAFFIITGMIQPCLADGLDSDAIHAFYKEAADAAMDPNKTLDVMQKQLADQFTLELTVSLNLGNGQPHNTSQTLSKEQLMTATRNSAQTEKIEKFESAVTSIKYSTDKSQAYVNDSMTTVRLIDIPAPNGQTMQAHATEGEACLDFLRLIGGAIKITKSQCYQKVLINR